MKKLYTLVASIALVGSLNAQTIFSSNLSNWTSNSPDGFVGVKTSLETDSILEVSAGADYGTSTASLVNTENSHKRFTTQGLAVNDGDVYNLTFWVKGNGEIRTAVFDDRTGGGYSTYSNYITINSSTSASYTEAITIANTTSAAEFILSVRNTSGANHIEIDSVVIELDGNPPGTTINNVSIYDIQYATDISGDSPFKDSIVAFSGIVTAVDTIGGDKGFYVQDADTAWSGVFVHDFTPVLRGDSVYVRGLVTEFNGMTQIDQADSISIMNSGNTVQAAIALATNDANTEKYESMLISIANGTCTATADNFGEWAVNDGSGTLKANDQIYVFEPTAFTIYDVTGALSYSFGEYKIEPRDMNDIDSVGVGQASIVSIAAIQYSTDSANAYPSSYEGQIVTTRGIVTAIAPEGYFIQDGDTAWSGIYVFDTLNVLTIARGDSVEVTATVDEFYDFTELKDITAFSVLSTGNTEPTGLVVATGDVSNEAYESVLVQTLNATASGANNFGEYTLDDGSGTATANDLIFVFEPTPLTAYDVRGVVDYSFSTYLIEPRDMNDIDSVGQGTAPMVSIYAIQHSTDSANAYPSSYEGQIVTTKGIVTAIAPEGYFIQDGDTAWSGVYVFDTVNVAIVMRGDSVEVTAGVDEFYDYTELKDVVSFTVLSTGNTEPTGLVIPTGEVSNEAYESVLVQTQNGTAGGVNNFGEWTVDDGSGSGIVNDLIFAFTPTPLTIYNVRGVIDYAFSKYMMEPRDMNDIDSVGQGTAPDVSIYDIQYSTDATNDYPSPLAGQVVTTKGTVTATITASWSSNRGFFIQDGVDPWNGVFVADTVNSATLSIGDSVEVTGVVGEFFDLTRMESVVSVSVLATGVTVPGPVVVPTGDVNEEMYEGMLVKTIDATCINDDAGFGQWVIMDATSDSCIVDDEIYSFNAVENNVYNVTGVTFFAFGDYKLYPRMASDIEQTVPIYNIQYTTDASGASPIANQSVTTYGVVTAVTNDGYYIQDGSGAYTGVYVDDASNTVSRGDSVGVTATVEELFNKTILTDLTGFVSVGTSTVPSQTIVTTANANDEQYESVLIQVIDARCTNADVGGNFGEWTINDNSGALIADDLIFAYTPVQNTVYNVTGVLDFAFGAYKILPRDINDIALGNGINELADNSVAIYPNPATTSINVTGTTNGSFTIIDVTGKIVKTGVVNSTTSSINIADLAKGLYQVNVNGITTKLVIQ